MPAAVSVISLTSDMARFSCFELFQEQDWFVLIESYGLSQALFSKRLGVQLPGVGEDVTWREQSLRFRM